MSVSDSEVARLAIDSTPDDYFWKCIRQRVAGDETQCGSFYEENADELATMLVNAEWEAYPHPDVAEPARAYRTFDMKGTVGIVNLCKLAPDTPVTLRPSKKGTGFVECVVNGRDVPMRLAMSDFTTLIVGPDDGKEVMYTFHPGAPVLPSTAAGDVTEQLNASTAYARGWTYAKIETDPIDEVA